MNFVQSESCDCPQCQRALPATCVRTEQHASDRQTTRVFCPFCMAGWKVARQRIGSIWCVTGNVERITDGVELGKLRAEVEKLHGVIQIHDVKTRRRILNGSAVASVGNLAVA
jgi:hypothetical protein